MDWRNLTSQYPRWRATGIIILTLQTGRSLNLGPSLSGPADLLSVVPMVRGFQALDLVISIFLHECHFRCCLFVCFLIQTLILCQQVFLSTEPSPQALPISEYLIKGFWSYVIFSSLSWTKNSYSLTVLLHFSLPECVDRWESPSTDNIRYKTVYCLGLPQLSYFIISIVSLNSLNSSFLLLKLLILIQFLWEYIGITLYILHVVTETQIE